MGLFVFEAGSVSDEISTSEDKHRVNKGVEETSKKLYDCHNHKDRNNKEKRA